MNFGTIDVNGTYYIVNIGIEEVSIYECYKTDSKLKLVLPRDKWNRVQRDLQTTFNTRLRAQYEEPGKFKPMEDICIERMLGKEMMVLLWAIEDVEDFVDIERAIVGWKALADEERWWLYMMTNAATGSIEQKDRGWRVALKFALCGLSK